MFRFFYSLVLMLGIFAQAEAQKDSLVGKDTSQIKTKVKPKIRMGVDISRLFLTATRSDFRGTELSFDVNFGQKIYEAHLGYAAHSQVLGNYKPVSEGIYFSAGMLKNLFADNNNILGFGGRLAASSYSYQATNVLFKDALSGLETRADLTKNQNLAVWFEAVGSLRAQVYGWLLMGFEVRMKPRLFSKVTGDAPYAIPGYGLYKNGMSFGFNYFLYLNLPTRK
jgi:hypothetical protein